MALVISCGIAAVLIFVMYLILDRFPANIYASPISLWLMAPVILAWLMRMWLLASRGEMDGDPIAFALRDRQSWVLGAACAVRIYLAWSGAIVASGERSRGRRDHPAQHQTESPL